MKLSEKQTALLESAKRYFDEGFYDKVSPLLNSLVAQKINLPDVYHMLGTIYYEHGQFKASINSFKRALEIDPDFTDSSIGLSVVLNDLGKYEMAQNVFKNAQERLKKSNSQENYSTNSVKKEIANKHLELSELYLEYKNPQEAFENILKFEEISQENQDTVLKKVKILRSLNNLKFAAQILKSWQYKQNNEVDAEIFVNLVEVYYIDQQPLAALSTCEQALRHYPSHPELLNLYKNLKTTTFDLRSPEMTL